MKPKLKTPDVTAILGITRERLQSWLNGGFIQPTVSGAGHGKKTLFTRDDVVAVALFNKLLAEGITRGVGAKVIRDLDKIERKQPASVEYLGIVPSKPFVFAIAPNAPLDLQQVERMLGASIDHLHIVNVSALAADVDARIRQYVQNEAEMSAFLKELGVPANEESQDE